MKLNLKRLSEPKTSTTITLYASVMEELREISDDNGWAIQKILASAVNTFIDTYFDEIEAEEVRIAKEADEELEAEWAREEAETEAEEQERLEGLAEWCDTCEEEHTGAEIESGCHDYPCHYERNCNDN